MPRKNAADKNALYRELPSVDELLRSRLGLEIAAAVGSHHAARLARAAIASVRSAIDRPALPEDLAARAHDALLESWRSESSRGTRRVINATGVIIHTNLGRAPLSEAAQRAMKGAAANSTVEYDLVSGKRGRRGSLAEELVAELTGAESALIVNNCAAAAFFVLHVFAAGGEAIISRGELVEIGGDFRVPDVLERSGAKLREVGTTNRTRLSDYQKAIRRDTRMILRVHPSNYRIVGFTAAVTVRELSTLAKKSKVILYEDIGSGALVDLSAFGLGEEPLARTSLKDGAAIVSFSGDKLLGGPQCGIIAGKRKLIEQLRRHPLQRALRVDKTTLAALEATLGSYRRGTHFREIPVLRQLAATAEEIEGRSRSLARKLRGGLDLKILPGESVVGGGSAPDVRPRTVVIGVKASGLSAGQIDAKLRSADPPVITRTDRGRVLIDLRTVAPDEERDLISALKGLS